MGKEPWECYQVWTNSSLNPNVLYEVSLDQIKYASKMKREKPKALEHDRETVLCVSVDACWLLWYYGRNKQRSEFPFAMVPPNEMTNIPFLFLKHAFPSSPCAPFGAISTLISWIICICTNQFPCLATLAILAFLPSTGAAELKRHTVSSRRRTIRRVSKGFPSGI